MCGILCRFTAGGAAPWDLFNRLEGIAHRGPDARGALGFDQDGPLLSAPDVDISGCDHQLGHNRLSIIDLSEAGTQPFVSEDQRWVLSYNGEIYNYVELRSELVAAGLSFVTDTDTEVLLQAWRHWGPGCLDRLEGMFAFVLVDRAEKTGYLARDGFGIKPLFYRADPGELLICSELYPLVADRPFDLEPGALPHLMRWGSDEGNPQTMVKGVRRLESGRSVSFDLETLAFGPENVFFDINTVQQQDWDFIEAKQRLRDEFVASVERHMRSDATLGFALSGGIDSSALVCVAKDLGRDPIRTFTYLAPDKDVNEHKWAQMIIDRVGAEAHFIEPSSRDVLKAIDTLVRHQGEPFGSLSIYAAYEVYSRVAEEGVKVMLNGQGADELLAGYNHYYQALIQSAVGQRQPRKALHRAATMQSRFGQSTKQTAMWVARALLPGAVREATARKVLANRASWLNIERMQEVGFDKFGTNHENEWSANSLHNTLKHGTSQNLQNLLRFEDRNAMAHSVENRVPFLTPSLAKLCLSFPAEFLVSDEGTTKYIFREAMRGIVPDQILDRKDKIGFAPANRAWLASLQELGNSVPHEEGLDGFVDQDQLRRSIADLTEGTVDERFDFAWKTMSVILSSQKLASAT